MASAPVLGGGSVDLDPVAFEAQVQHAARARDGARRAERAPARHRVDEDARRGVRRRRQAVATEGHRPCPGRLLALAAVDGRGHGVRPDAAPLHGQGQPQGAPRGAAQRAVAARRARVAGGVRRLGVRRAVDQAGGRSARRLGGDGADAGAAGRSEAAAGKSFRNLPRADAMPVDDAGVADLVGAASLLVSQAALESLVARAAGSVSGGDDDQSTGDDQEEAA